MLHHRSNCSLSGLLSVSHICSSCCSWYLCLCLRFHSVLNIKGGAAQKDKWQWWTKRAVDRPNKHTRFSEMGADEQTQIGTSIQKVSLCVCVSEKQWKSSLRTNKVLKCYKCRTFSIPSGRNQLEEQMRKSSLTLCPVIFVHHRVSS